MGRNAPARLVKTLVKTLVKKSSASAAATARPAARQNSGAPHSDPALRPKGGPRGFAADPKRASEAGRRGGKHGQAKGTAHRWTTEEARAAGGLRGDPGLGKGQRRDRRRPPR